MDIENNNPKIPMETQKTLKSQKDTEQKKTMLDVSQYLTSNYTTETSNINSMILAQQQTHTPMK
jgi:hypothetical protein